MCFVTYIQLQPWNVDTISQPGFEKTVSTGYWEFGMFECDHITTLIQIINKSAAKKKEELTEDERFEKTVSDVSVCMYACMCVPCADVFVTVSVLLTM